MGLLPPVAATFLLSMTGCSVVTNTFPPPPPKVVVESPVRQAAAVLLESDRCPVTGAPSPALGQQFVLAGLAVAAIGAILSTAWAAIQSYIQESKNNLTASYFADGIGSLGKSKCLIIVNGTFGPVQTTTPAQGALTLANLTQLGLADYPKLYMEAWVVRPNLSSSRILIAPSLFQFGATEAKNPGDDVKSISIVLTFSDQPQQSAPPPDPAPPPPTSPVVQLPKGRPAAADGNQSKPGSNPTGATPPSTTTVAIPFEFRNVEVGTFTRESSSTPHVFVDQQRVASVSGDQAVNLHALITETSDPDLLTNVMIATLPQSSKTIDDALTTAIQKALASAPAKAPAK